MCKEFKFSDYTTKKNFAEELGKLLSRYPETLGIESMTYYSEEESKELVNKMWMVYESEVVVIKYEGGGHHIAFVNGDSIWGMLEDIVKAAY